MNSAIFRRGNIYQFSEAMIFLQQMFCFVFQLVGFSAIISPEDTSLATCSECIDKEAFL